VGLLHNHSIQEAKKRKEKENPRKLQSNSAQIRKLQEKTQTLAETQSSFWTKGEQAWPTQELQDENKHISNRKEITLLLRKAF
jgi:hypothetical protein